MIKENEMEQIKSWTNSEYADRWEEESTDLDNNKIYEKLNHLLPEGNVLEFGCGCGLGTLQLLKNRHVLSIDNNCFLINKAKNKIKNDNSIILKCDFFKLSKKDINIIKEFRPKIIVGWFLGGNGIDVKKNTQGFDSKLYREKIEDIIVSEEICGSYVEIIQFATRGIKRNNVTDRQLIDELTKNYNDYVFIKNGFEVEQIDFLDWNHFNKSFQYQCNFKNNIDTLSDEFRVTSIIAKKIKN